LQKPHLSFQSLSAITLALFPPGTLTADISYQSHITKDSLIPLRLICNLHFFFCKNKDGQISLSW
jgi:hypothetical protein